MIRPFFTTLAVLACARPGAAFCATYPAGGQQSIYVSAYVGSRCLVTEDAVPAGDLSAATALAAVRASCGYQQPLVSVQRLRTDDLEAAMFHADAAGTLAVVVTY